MGKIDTSKTPRDYMKPMRRSILGKHTLGIILKPNLAPGNGNAPGLGTSPEALFNMLIDSNKNIVKGSKLYESLSEMRLCGWIHPCTLLLSGPREDVRIIKHFWTKRLLRNPKGYFIVSLGIIRELIVETLPQSQFMSLTTALFDAISDLNQSEVYPDVDKITNYLRKTYPDLQTPEHKVIVGCLGRLVDEKKIFHNGKGYFVLMSENVLNNTAKVQKCLKPDDILSNLVVVDCSSTLPSSSPVQTDFETESSPKVTHALEISQEEVTTSSSETAASTPGVVKKFFTRNAKIDKGDIDSKKDAYAKAVKPRLFSCGITGTMTDSIINLKPVEQMSNDITIKNRVPIESLISVSKDVTLDCSSHITDNGSKDLSHENEQMNGTCGILKSSNKDNSGITSEGSSEDTICQNSNEELKEFVKKSVNLSNIKKRRSRSFNGGKLKKDVSFADNHDQHAPSSNESFRRSESFGKGKKNSRSFKKCGIPNFPLDSNSKYSDVRNSFIDDSLPEMNAFRLANGYESLKGNDNEYPSRNTRSLAEELDLSYEYPQEEDHFSCTSRLESMDSNNEMNDKHSLNNLPDMNDSTFSLQYEDVIETSAPNIQRAPYESQYTTFNVSGSPSIADGSPHQGIKFRTKTTKTPEERRKSQKERNSKLFEEKLSSLTILGRV